MTENMDITSNVETEATSEGENTQTQVESKLFTQEQVNEIVAKRVGQVKSKFSYDPSEVEELKAFKDSIEEQQLLSRQDFDKVLAKHREKANSEIQSLRSELEKIKIDGALINASSKAGAVAPEQVAKLLKDSVKLQADGTVVVLDSEGNPRYNDDAEAFSLDMLVDEFLATNAYFKTAGPSGTGSKSNTSQVTQQELDLASLDMTNPEHRAIYKKMRAQGKL